MPVAFEFKAKGKPAQYTAIDEAIRTGQFIRNKCLRLWLDVKGTNKMDLYKYCKVLAHEFPFANKLNSTARQAMSERAWSSISRFYEKCRRKVPGKKGFPKFKHNSRSVEYKQSGWKLSPNRKQITFTDKIGIGLLKLKGTWDLHFYQVNQIKRVRLIKRADGYYVQFLVDTEVNQSVEATGNTIGLDVGLKEFYTDSDGNAEPNPRFYKKSEKRIKFYQRRVSRKKKGGANRLKAINKLGRVHLVLKSLAGRKPTPPTFRKISRRREEYAKRVARCVVRSNDLVAYEDLRIKNLVKNHCLAVLKSLAGRKPTPPRQFLHLGRPQDRTASTFRKSINDAAWYQFRKWLEYFGTKFGKVTLAVNPAYTTQNCSSCGTRVLKSLSTRTHVCRCGCVLDRDHNAAINILNSALSTTGHVGTWINNSNALGDPGTTEAGVFLSQQPGS